MTSHILAKLYGLILEKKISLWLESHGKRDKEKFGFRRPHSTIAHLVTLRIIAEEFQNSKINLFYFFLDFRKKLDIVLWDKLWEILEEIMVLPELRIFVIHLYETVVSKLNTNKGWYKYIKCNIWVKQGCPLFPTLFGIYIDKLEKCLETASCKETKLVGIIITLLLYDNDIVLLSEAMMT